MGKLKATPPRLSSAKPRIGFAQGDAKAQGVNREAFAPWRAWYRTARWARLRQSVLKRDIFTCQMCGKTLPSPDLVADHIRPHRGDPALFWCGIDGLQTLCHHPCHSKHKQALERSE